MKHRVPYIFLKACIAKLPCLKRNDKMPEKMKRMPEKMQNPTKINLICNVFGILLGTPYLPPTKF